MSGWGGRLDRNHQAKEKLDQAGERGGLPDCREWCRSAARSPERDLFAQTTPQRPALSFNVRPSRKLSGCGALPR